VSHPILESQTIPRRKLILARMGFRRDDNENVGSAELSCPR
jgi:hypothetical protein